MISKLLNLATKYGLPFLAIGLIAFSIRYLAQAKERLPKVPPPVQPASNPFRNTVAGAGMVDVIRPQTLPRELLQVVILFVAGPVRADNAELTTRGFYLAELGGDSRQGLRPANRLQLAVNP